VSGKKALIDAGLSPDGSDIKQLDTSRAGILIGSAMGGMTSFTNAVEALEVAGE
jgi:3-oxoacyl-[acyl-carrier-protein] synthase II